VRKHSLLLTLRGGALTGTLLVGILTPAGAPYAKTDPCDQATYNAFDCDTQKLTEIIEFGVKGYNVVSGLIKIIDFLTGISGGPAPEQITLQSIQQAALSAANMKGDNDFLTKEVQGHTLTFNRIAEQVKGRFGPDASDQDIQTSDFGKIFLATSLSQLTFGIEHSLPYAEDVLQLPASTVENAERVAKLLPGYLTLIPLYVSSYKILSGIDQTFRTVEDSQIPKTLARAQQILVNAVGAYVLHGYECDKDQILFYSPVGADNGWMFARPLYAYYHIRAGRFDFVPALSFELYQNQKLPISAAALDSLQKMGTTAPAIVMTHDAYIFNLYTDPNDVRSNPSFVPCMLGSIVRPHR
jgi:hypothetical protein